MPKKGLPSYRLYKRSGQAVVTLNGKDHYLGRYKSKASREEYEKIIAEYIANGKKLAPTLAKTGISIEELGIRFLEWAEKYYVKNGKQTGTFNFCQNAISLLTRHYGNESVNNFGPLSLVFLQEKWVEQGLRKGDIVIMDNLLAERNSSLLPSQGLCGLGWSLGSPGRCFYHGRGGWFEFFPFPTYSPELNPVEPCWHHTKNIEMANFTAKNKNELS